MPGCETLLSLSYMVGKQGYNLICATYSNGQVQMPQINTTNGQGIINSKITKIQYNKNFSFIVSSSLNKNNYIVIGDASSNNTVTNNKLIGITLGSLLTGPTDTIVLKLATPTSLINYKCTNALQTYPTVTEGFGLGYGFGLRNITNTQMLLLLLICIILLIYAKKNNYIKI